MSIAFVFPGEGSQFSGMLHQLLPNRATQQVLDQISEALGFDVRKLDAAKELRSVVSIQLAIFAAGVATARPLVDSGLQVAAVAGHSIGAFAAAVTADVLSLRDAVELVRLRAQSMESLYPSGYGLSAIVGLSEAQVTAIVEGVTSSNRPVFIANINAPRQIVIAGENNGMDLVLMEALRGGARKAIRLRVPVLSHCPLLQPVADMLNSKISNMKTSPPRVPFLANVSGRALRTAEQVAKDLAENVAHGVRWYDASVVLTELGCNLFLEMPPGHVLTDLAEQNLPTVRAIAVSAAVTTRILRLARLEHP